MPLKLCPFGEFRVYPTGAFSHPGPIATRAAAPLESIAWKNDTLGDVSLTVGMGSYLQGPYAAHVTVRMALKTGDGVPFFFEYKSVGEMESHVRGESPIFLAGLIEIDPGNEKYAWLNRVQIIGRGMLTMDPICQTYQMAYTCA